MHELAELEQQVLRLSEKERRQFAAWFYHHEAELAGATADSEDDLSDEQKAELTRRLKEIEEHPEILVPFEVEDFDRMSQEFADERAQRTSARPQ